MKKLVATVLTVLSCGAVYALPVGNISEASSFTHGLCMESACCDPCDLCFSWCDAWSFRMGFAGDYVFNRNMELKNGNGGIGTTEIYTNAGYIAFNMCDRLDIFTRLGASTLNLTANSLVWDYSPFDPSNLGVQSEVSFQTAFSWSIGARATLWECNCFALGLEGEYFQTSPDFDAFMDFSDGTIAYFNSGNNATYKEWQVGLGASYRFATGCPTLALVPYMAVKWAGSSLDMGDFEFTREELFLKPSGRFADVESSKLWGYAIGMSFTLCDMVGVTVEGRFADEKAVSVNGQFRF